MEIGQECPGCKAGLPVKVRGCFNLIHRARPILRKGADGKVIKLADGSYVVDGYGDEVVVWECANTTLQYIKECDNNFGGLMSRDLRLGLSGNNFQPYSLFPASIDGGAQPLNETDQALLGKRHDIDKFMAPPTLQEAATIVAKYGANSGAQQNMMPMVPVNQYAIGTVPASPFGGAQPQPQQPPVQAPVAMPPAPTNHQT